MKFLRLSAVFVILSVFVCLTLAFQTDDVSAVGSPISGDGTTDRIAIFTGGQCIGDSVIREDGVGNVGIGATNGAVKLLVQGGRLAVNGSEGSNFGILIANQNGAGPIATFSTNGGAAEQMVINNNGTVGIRGGNPGLGKVLTSINGVGDAVWQLQGSAGRTPISSLPFPINACGSYFLTGCLTGTSGQNGITIDADDVTLDLNGFALIGVVGSLDGISVGSGRRNVSITNGTVRSWGGDGVDCLAQQGYFQNLHLSGNGGVGLLTGQGSVLVDCMARNNPVAGFEISNTTMRYCTAVSNGDGIRIGALCIVTDCTTSINTFAGMRLMGSNSIISKCTTAGDEDGIVAIGATGHAIIGNTFNGLIHGIFVDDTSCGFRIDSNHVSGNIGIRVDQPANSRPHKIFRNSAFGNIRYMVGAANDFGPIESAATGMSPWGNL